VDPNSLDDMPDIKLPNNPMALAKQIRAGARFVKDEKIPEFYWHVITVCWQSPERRPSFAALLSRDE
jgi:hypothetical protein